MNINEMIKQRRKELGMILEDVAKVVGVNRSSIYKYENGDTEKLPTQVLVPLAKALKCSSTYLLGIEDELVYKGANIDSVKVPLYSSICCGDGGFNDDNILDYVSVPSQKLAPSRQYFAQYAKGDSMNGVGIDDGDLLVFELTSQIDSGQIGSFCIDENEATCKKFTIQNNLIILQPANSKYDPIIIDPTNQHFRCVGKLILSIKNFE